MPKKIIVQQELPTEGESDLHGFKEARTLAYLRVVNGNDVERSFTLRLVPAGKEEGAATIIASVFPLGNREIYQDAHRYPVPAGARLRGLATGTGVTVYAEEDTAQ